MAAIRYCGLMFILLHFSRGTVDLNIHQLQMVADHLDGAECRQLVGALRQNKSDLKDLVAEGGNEDRPCIGLLLQWDREEGVGASFDDLALRLSQIGKRDLSEKLSQVVYEEKAKELDNLFLRDPFKQNVSQDSVLLAGSNKTVQKTETQAGGEQLKTWEILSIISGSVIAFLFISYAIYWLFGDAVLHIFRQYAPEFIVKWVDLVSDQWKWVFKKTKRRYMKDVVGSNVESGIQGNQSRRKRSLAELNRSLNCYLNGNSKEAMHYLDELLKKPRSGRG